MLRVARYHTTPLPKGWPHRVRSAVIQVISLARVARRITPPRGSNFAFSSPFTFGGPLQPDPLCWRWHEKQGVRNLFHSD